MEIKVIWMRDEYKMAGGGLSLFSRYLSSLLTRKTIQILDLCGFMSELNFTTRQKIEG